MCCQSILIFTQIKVHSHTGSHCGLSVTSDCVALSTISVLCYCWLLLYGPEALGPTFVSSHPLCISTELVLSPAFRPLSLRGVELEAELNRWAAVSQEWNFSLTGLWGVGLGMRRWRNGGCCGEWGKLLTKRLSLGRDKLPENHWDEAKTQVTGESARAQMSSFTVNKELLFYRCGRVLFFLKDAENPWNRRLPHTNRKPFTVSLHTNTARRKERKKIWNLTSSNLEELLSCGLVDLNGGKLNLAREQFNSYRCNINWIDHETQNKQQQNDLISL